MSGVETTVALTGNTYLAQRVSAYRDTRFLKVVEYLRSADVTLTNLECTIPDPGTPPAYVAGMGWGATYMVGTAAMLDELKFMGISAVCAANNHVMDFGEAGVLSTARELTKAGIPFAGIGASLTEASQAAYIDTPTGLRLAFIAACDWGPRGRMGLNFPWPVGYFASDDAPPFVPRPGVNLLRYDAVSYVTAEQLGQLRRISEALDWENDKLLRRSGFHRSHPLVGMTTNIGVEEDTDTDFYFLGRKFAADDKAGQHTVACTEDLDRIYKQIREARRQADIVCVAFHDQSHGERVPDYIDTIAHGALDAGADIYFNNGGTHKGIEVYKGRAIIHGQPGLFLQTEAVTHVPSSEMGRYRLPADSTASDFIDARAEYTAGAFEKAGDRPVGAPGSAVHLCVFDEQARLKEIRIQPLQPLGGTTFAADAEIDVPRFRRGLPLMPEPESPLSRRLLEYSVNASKPFGTLVEIRDGLGVVRIA
jgi:poly-gamma-glutamate capsule biosynthesis protein CapA/YwtB (metallophosphatase superfamily)